MRIVMGRVTFELSDAVAAVIVGLLTFLAAVLIEGPRKSREVRVTESSFQLELVCAALVLPDAEDRARSLIILLDAGLLFDEMGAVRDWAEDPSDLPDWSQANSCGSELVGS